MLRLTPADEGALPTLGGERDAFTGLFASPLPLEDIDVKEDMDDFDEGAVEREGTPLFLGGEETFLTVTLTTVAGSGLASFAPLKAKMDFWRSGVGADLKESINS